MPNNTVKSFKNIKEKSKAHPYSRKAKQINRASVRQERLQKNAAKQSKAKAKEVDKLVWFKHAIPPREERNAETLTNSDLNDVILLYIDRNDDEIEKLKSELRPGRPRPATLQLLEELKQEELKQYQGTIGLELPALDNPATLKHLESWNGEDHSCPHYHALVKMTKKISQCTVLKDSKEGKDVEMS